jgi:hypothetical protein
MEIQIRLQIILNNLQYPWNYLGALEKGMVDFIAPIVVFDL